MLKISRWLTGSLKPFQRVALPQKQWRTFAALASPLSPPVASEEKIRLREYQEECIQSVLNYLKDGQKRLGISLATGAGKTIIFTRLIDRVESSNKRGTQTLILAHRRELVEQAAKHCERAYPNKSIEVEMGKIQASGAADITVASIQSMLSSERYLKYDPKRFKLILVDEAHHIVSSGYMELLKYFQLHEHCDDSPALVGVSATFSRFDGLKLGMAIDHIVYHKDYMDMIGEKWLSDVIFTTVKSRVDLSQVGSSRNGDFAIKPLSEAVNTAETNDIIIKSWLSQASDRKSTLIFCVDINHVVSLTDMFRARGIDARYITGSTRKKIRSERLEQFKRREYPVLINCGVFTEGTDMPNIDCVLLARPTKSRNLLVQMIGRGMRLYPAKKNCHVIDMVASLETGIVTTPTLFGLDPSEMVEKSGIEDLKDLKEKKDALQGAQPGYVDHNCQHSIGRTTHLDFTHYDSIQDLIEDTSGERHVRALSQNAWVQVDSGKYVLNAQGGILTLERSSTTKDDPSEQSFEVIWKHTIPSSGKTKAPWSRPRTVATASTLASALNAADTFAASKFDRIWINTGSKWRKSPASETQVAFLNRVLSPAVTGEMGSRAKDGGGDGDGNGAEDDDGGYRPMLTADDITKGQAGDMITKIKFGAKGRFDKLMLKKKKAEKRERKAEELKGREVVRVGPLEA